MIFFKKIIVTKDSTPCGCASLQLDKDNYNLNVTSLNLNESKSYLINIKNDKKCLLETEILGKNLKNLKISLKNTNNVDNICFSINEINKNTTAQAQQTEKDRQKEEKTGTNPTFFETIREKVEKMLKSNKPIPSLEAKFENSKWVKVEFDNSGLFYAFGIIYSENTPKYICYAIPSNKSATPPKHLEEFCKFVETDESGNGFYVMMQNAQNGECVK